MLQIISKISDATWLNLVKSAGSSVLWIDYIVDRLSRLCVNFIFGDSIAIGTMSCFLFQLVFIEIYQLVFIEIYFR